MDLVYLLGWSDYNWRKFGDLESWKIEVWWVHMEWIWEFHRTRRFWNFWVWSFFYTILKGIKFIDLSILLIDLRVCEFLLLISWEIAFDIKFLEGGEIKGRKRKMIACHLVDMFLAKILIFIHEPILILVLDFFDSSSKNKIYCFVWDKQFLLWFKNQIQEGMKKSLN